MEKLLREALTSIGDDSPIVQLRSVSGGTINQAYQVQTTQQHYFVKINKGIKRDFFLQERKGLQLLRQTKTISIPKVYGEWYEPQTKQGILVLEWVEGQTTKETEEQLGRKLAKLHRSYGTAFGLAEDNYLGYLPQRNGWSQDWATFYRDQRIRPQVALGQQKGLIQGKRLQKCKKIIERIDVWLNHKPKPSPLHGDLWSGNWITGPAGEPYLIDPAVFFGDHELDIAFTECFGGFSTAFYHGYQAVFPLSADYPARRPLYQLLFLLVHLNLFGESYGPRIDEILGQYV